MHRRAYLAAAGSLSLALAGCTAGGDGGDGGASTETPPMTDEPTDITNTSFSRRQECTEAGAAEVGFDAEAGSVTVMGCIWGKNGCMQARLAGASYDAGADQLTVVVETFDPTEPGTACTEALVSRGYEVAVEFSGALPGTVAVVHDNYEGRREVARMSR